MNTKKTKVSAFGSALLQTKQKKKRKQRRPSVIVYERDLEGNRIYKDHKRYKRNQCSSTSNSQNEPCDASEDFEASDDFEASGNANCNDRTHEELNTIVESVNFLQSVNLKRKAKSWTERLHDSEELWKEEREKALGSCLEREFLKNSCFKCGNESCIFCEECSFNLCWSCDVEVHSQLTLHNRKAKINGFLKPLCPTEHLVEDGSLTSSTRYVPLVISKCEVCNIATYNLTKIEVNETCTVITNKGRYDLHKFKTTCSVCNSSFDPFNIKTLISCGYWPSSFKSSTYIIKEEVFLKWDMYRKRMPGSSEKSFLNSLNDITSHYGRVGSIYPHPFGIVFREWSICRQKLLALQKINLFECPCCSINQHSCHVDGNCKLYRYASSGKRRRKSIYGDTFIVDDEDVKNFIHKVYGSKAKYKQENDTLCGGVWSAAKNVGRKKKSLDDTGLEVATCRHVIAQKAINMKQGELYGYALYLMKYFMVGEWKVEYCWADVMCKLWKFVKRIEPALCDRMKPALSTMHAKGHSIQCQVQWDGLWVEGTGRSTGEETEQFFSYISRCGNTTKYQLPERREETITEHAMHWNRIKITKLAETLVKKFNRISKELKETRKDFTNQATMMKVTEKEMPSIVEDIKTSALSTTSRIEFEKLPADEKFVLVFFDLKALKSLAINSIKTSTTGWFAQYVMDDFHELGIVPGTLKGKETLLNKLSSSLGEINIQNSIMKTITGRIRPRIRSEIERHVFEKTFWKATLAKRGDRCKRRSVYRLQIGKCTNALKKCLNLLEASGEKLNELSRARINCGRFPWCITTNTNDENLPAEDKRLIAETYARIQRSEEEIDLLKRDMKNYLLFYREKIAELKTVVENEASPVVEVVLAKRGLSFAEDQLAEGVRYFSVVFNIQTEFSMEIPVNEEEIVEEEVVEEVIIGLTATNDTLKELAQEVSANFDLSCCSEDVEGNFSRWYLPFELSQGAIGGRNGSSACTVISLLVGHFCGRSKDLMMDKLLLFIGCMELGNTLHENQNLVNLNLYEGLSLLPESLNVELFEEAGNIITQNTSIPLEFSMDTFFVFIANEKSFSFFREGDDVYFFDSHANPPHGACVHVVPAEHFDTFIKGRFMNQYVNIGIFTS
eukprot:TCONS_00046776-protein